MTEYIDDIHQLKEMLNHYETIHIALQDGDYPYIVPMNYGIGEQESPIVLYIYTPREGKMADLMKKNPHVGIQAETLYEYFFDHHKTLSCSYSSITGQGLIENLPHEDYDRAMKSLLIHYGYETYPYNKDYLENCIMYKITIQKMTGKNHFKGV